MREGNRRKAERQRRRKNIVSFTLQMLLKRHKKEIHIIAQVATDCAPNFNSNLISQQMLPSNCMRPMRCDCQFFFPYAPRRGQKKKLIVKLTKMELCSAAVCLLYFFICPQKTPRKRITKKKKVHFWQNENQRLEKNNERQERTEKISSHGRETEKSPPIMRL